MNDFEISSRSGRIQLKDGKYAWALDLFMKPKMSIDFGRSNAQEPEVNSEVRKPLAAG